MSSKDLAETIFRAEKISDLVRQIDSLDFCISDSNPGKIYIKDGQGKIDKNSPLVDVGGMEIPKEMAEKVGVERICSILNDNLERAKFKILKEAQMAVFSKLDFEEPEEKLDEDDFIPVK
jgi:hypothetical protein